MGRVRRPAALYLLTVAVIAGSFLLLPRRCRPRHGAVATALASAGAISSASTATSRRPTQLGRHRGRTGRGRGGELLVGVQRLGIYGDRHPSSADAILLVSGLLLLAGVLGLLRERVIGNRRAGLLDALLTATAASMVASTYLVLAVEVNDVAAGVVVTATAYAVASLVLLAVAAPLWFAVEGVIDVSARILVLAMLVLVATNVAYRFAVLADLPPPIPGVQASISCGWLMFFVLIALAALHPSMGRPPAKRADTEVDPPSWKRFAALIVFAGLAPLAVVLGDRAQGRSLDLVTIVVGDVAMIALVIVRMSDIQADLRGALRRERNLRIANDELVAAVDVTQVRRVLVDTATALLSRRGSRVWLVEDPRVAGYLPPPDAVGRVQVLEGPQDLRSTLSIDDGAVLVVAELPSQTGIELALVAATASAPRREVVAALDSLVHCAALAADRVSLGQLVLARQSEIRLQRLLQDASDVVAVLDRRMVVRYVTPAVERVLALTPREVIGSRWLEHVWPADQERSEAMIQGSNEGWPARGEVQLLARDGTTRHVEVAVSRVAEADGGGFTLACHDVTVRHELEEQLSTRPSTTPSPAWPTARCSRTACATSSTARAAPASSSPCCSSTSTTSRP